MLSDTKAVIAAILQLFSITSGFLNVSEDYSTIRYFQKSFKRFLKVINCTQQLQVREKRGGI